LGVRQDIAAALRFYRRCAALDDCVSIEHLGLCYENGIGVDVDFVEAARSYRRSSELGSATGRLNLGFFYWRGLGGFPVDRREAVRLWRLSGLEFPDSAIADDSSVSGSPSDSTTRFDRFLGSEVDLGERREDRLVRGRLLVCGTREYDREVPGDQTRMDGRPVGARQSFSLSYSDHVIESVVLFANQSVRDFLGEGLGAGEVARLAGEGIAREGFRCLGGAHEGQNGEALCAEMMRCDTIESLLHLSAEFYTRDTFLYRRVNTFLRSGTDRDLETGRNLGLYIGLLRECFCVCGGLSPLSWECPQVVYRGANFSIDHLIDYARRQNESIRWQGFTSSSRDIRVALSFPGNVLCEISLAHDVASLSDISAFKNEQEFILSPYQWFRINGVRWNDDYGRWIFSIEEESELREVKSWFAKVED
jgi:hypothetical protein